MKKTLAEAKPMIAEFHNALDVVLRKGNVKSGPEGRSTDGLIYVLSGRAHYTLDDESVDVREGDLLYLRKAVHFLLNVQTDIYHVLLVNFSFMPEQGLSLSCSVSSGNGKNTETQFRRLLTVWQTGGNTEKISCMACLYQIYASFIKTYEMEYISPAKRQKMTEAQKYINDHLGNAELSVSGIARAVKMSEPGFRRAFKALYKMTPSQYISMQKIARAKEMIIYSEERFSQISDRLGFCDAFHFSHIFKREVGCSPSEYRKRFGSAKI